MSLGAQGGFGGHALEKESAWEGPRHLHTNEKSVFFIFPRGQLFIFIVFFDGRPCRLQRYSHILVRRVQGAYGVSSGALGGVLGGAYTRLEGLRGCLNIEFGISEKVQEGQTVTLSNEFYDF